MKVFIDAHPGEHGRTFLRKVSLIKVKLLLCADEDQEDSVSGDPSHFPALPSWPSAHSTCSLLPCNPSTPSKLVLVPKRALQQPDRASTQGDKHPPNRDVIISFLVAIYLSPEGPK